jgi:hypothetical protein
MGFIYAWLLILTVCVVANYMAISYLVNKVGDDDEV